MGCRFPYPPPLCPLPWMPVFLPCTSSPRSLGGTVTARPHHTCYLTALPALHPPCALGAPGLGPSPAHTRWCPTLSRARGTLVPAPGVDRARVSTTARSPTGPVPRPIHEAASAQVRPRAVRGTRRGVAIVTCLPVPGTACHPACCSPSAVPKPARCAGMLQGDRGHWWCVCVFVCARTRGCLHAGTCDLYAVATPLACVQRPAFCMDCFCVQ